MNNLRASIALMVIICYCCCNPVKKVLDSNSKTQQVVDSWLANNPLKVDTVTNFLKGDTITQLVVGYDTTFVPGDTITNVRIDTLRIKTTALKTQTIKDTIVTRIVDNRLLNACQLGLQKTQAAAVDAKSAENKWKIRFFSVVGGVLLLLCIIIIVKIK